jgi:hypothetical protein
MRTAKTERREVVNQEEEPSDGVFGDAMAAGRE